MSATDPVLRTFTKSLQVVLTITERHKLALDLAGEQGRLEAARGAKEEATKTHNGIIKGHEATVQQLATAVNCGWMYRDVECEELEDWVNKRILQVRTDTGDQIDERPMSEHERQRKLV